MLRLHSGLKAKTFFLSNCFNCRYYLKGRCLQCLLLYMLCNRHWRDKHIHGEREGVISMIILCCVVSLTKSLGMPHLRAFTGGFTSSFY